MKYPRKIRSGAFEAKMYCVKNRDRSVYQVRYYDHDRVEQRITRASAEAAELAWKDAVFALTQGKTDSVVMSDMDRLMLDRAKQALAKVGVPLDVAVLDYVRALESLDGTPLQVAVEHFTRSGTSARESIPVDEAVRRFLKDREDRGRSADYVRSLRIRLQRFEKSFQCQLETVSPEQKEQYLSTIGGEYRNKENHRRDLITFFNHAKSMGWVSKDHLGVGGNGRSVRSDKEIEVFTPTEMETILRCAPVKMIPALAIGGFAGLRTAEIERLDWADVHWEEREIHISAAKAKTKTRRIVPISDNLAAWLAPFRKADGKVVAYKRRLGDEFSRFAYRKDVNWKVNGLRHSAISYKVALVKDLGPVALESGNTPRVIQTNYLKVTTEAIAIKWFAITPETVGRELPSG